MAARAASPAGLLAGKLRIENRHLAAAGNYIELKPRPETILHLDGRHMGLGGDTGWSQNVHPEYRILPGEFRWRYRLRPLFPGEDPMAVVRRGMAEQT